MKKPRVLVWLRRDLRLEDHALLAQAESDGLECVLAFVFDEKILKKLANKSDRRVSFFHAGLVELDSSLQKKGSCLAARHGDPVVEIPLLAQALGCHAVLASRDYEAYAKERDAKVATALGSIPLQLFKDQVIFEGSEILSGAGTPYKVFTAYKNEWMKQLGPEHYDERGTRLPKLTGADELKKHVHPWSLRDLGFVKTDSFATPGEKAAKKQLESFSKKIGDYKALRDIPSADGTSALSVHLRFGTISIRACVREALRHKNEGARTWLSELIWRDFYHMVLDQFPHVGKGEAFRREYNDLKWPGKEAHFLAWTRGETGFPIVDAAMRHFNATGWMHNRLRMVVASFLTKDLLVSWKKGEEYFAKGLLDFDFAANNGGWQWSASTGCDAQPYFRVFNPYSQSERFDPEGRFIRANIPELAHLSKKEIHKPGKVKGYPSPIVDHSVQRDKAIALFK